jgi:hypothetical protein
MQTKSTYYISVSRLPTPYPDNSEDSIEFYAQNYGTPTLADILDGEDRLQDCHDLVFKGVQDGGEFVSLKLPVCDYYLFYCIHLIFPFFCSNSGLDTSTRSDEKFVKTLSAWNSQRK